MGADSTGGARLYQFELDEAVSLSGFIRPCEVRRVVYVLYYTDGNQYVGQSVVIVSCYATHNFGRLSTHPHRSAMTIASAATLETPSSAPSDYPHNLRLKLFLCISRWNIFSGLLPRTHYSTETLSKIKHPFKTLNLGGQR